MNEYYHDDERDTDEENDVLYQALIEAVRKHNRKKPIDRKNGRDNTVPLVFKIGGIKDKSEEEQARIKSETITSINRFFDNVKIHSLANQPPHSIFITGESLAKIYDQLIQDGSLTDPRSGAASSATPVKKSSPKTTSSTRAASAAAEPAAHKRKKNTERSKEEVKKQNASPAAAEQNEEDEATLKILVQAFVDYRKGGNIIDPHNYNMNVKHKIVISVAPDAKENLIKKINKALNNVTKLPLKPQRLDYPGGRPVDEPDNQIWLLAKAITSIYAHLKDKVEQQLKEQPQAPASSAIRQAPAALSQAAFSNAKAAAAVGIFNAASSAAASSAVASSPAPAAKPLSLASPYVMKLQAEFEALKKRNEEHQKENAALAEKAEVKLLKQKIEALKKESQELDLEEAALKAVLGFSDDSAPSLTAMQKP